MDHHGLESTKKFVSDVFPSRRQALSKDAPTCIRSGKQTLEGHVKCWLAGGTVPMIFAESVSEVL